MTGVTNVMPRYALDQAVCTAHLAPHLGLKQLPRPFSARYPYDITFTLI